MANMSYCRFENTLADLADCTNAMAEAESVQEFTSEMSDYERRAFYEMFDAAREFLAEHEQLLQRDTEAA